MNQTIKDNQEKAEKNKFDYVIEPITDTEYSLNIILYTQSRLFKFIFDKAKKKLMRKGINPQGNPDKIKAFDIPENYLKMVKFHIRPNWNIVAEALKEEGTFLQDYEIISARFVKDKEYPLWQIHIKLNGSYIDAR